MTTSAGSHPLWDLRSQLFTLDPSELGLTPGPELPRVWGVLMEIGYPEGPVSLVVIGDGTVSLYLPTGGGIIGAGAHRPVWAAGKALLETAEDVLELLDRPSDSSFPGPGEVKFHVLTFMGPRMAGGPERTIATGLGPLSALFWAGQAVITQIRLIVQRQNLG